jgi:GNAT superfamily N-acetyltransferase
MLLQSAGAALDAGILTAVEPCVPEKEKLVVTDTIDSRSFRLLLEQVHSEDCTHSWRNFGLDHTPEGLLAWENSLRPTRVFYFWKNRDGKNRLVAAAAVADRLTQDFPHDGFCVLARCYIMPEYRGQGLYRHILNYRLDYCTTRFGNQLNAVHLGTVNDRVIQVLSSQRVSGWPTFLHIGEEEFDVAGHVHRVGAYMLLVPSFVERLDGSLRGLGASAAVVDLRQALSRIGSADIRNWGMLIKRALEGPSLEWFGGREPRELNQLLDFCRAVPLVGCENTTCTYRLRKSKGENK